ncbi:MAG: hypothetical protein H0V20_00955 [Actinobacteria bacterium]|nr:hypothetical protein [Actinomycetota bacterium]
MEVAATVHPDRAAAARDRAFVRLTADARPPRPPSAFLQAPWLKLTSTSRSEPPDLVTAKTGPMPRA